MKLPDHFTFSQNNLQDYYDCPRRFFLRHILQQEWPAIESRPVQDQEELISLGQRFHTMVQQYCAGVPADLLESSVDSPKLLTWWFQWLKGNFVDPSVYHSVETSFSIPFQGYTLVAKYDLIIHDTTSSLIIYDWKTSEKLPKKEYLLKRIQSKVYPYLIAMLASQPSQAFTCLPEQITMKYWFPAFPDLDIQFQYSQNQLEKDYTELNRLVQEIFRLDESGFSKTDNSHLCSYCRYRSLCDRGTEPGLLRERNDFSEDDSTAFDIDFDAIN